MEFPIVFHITEDQAIKLAELAGLDLEEFGKKELYNITTNKSNNLIDFEKNIGF